MRSLPLYEPDEYPWLSLAAPEPHAASCSRCGPALQGPRRCLPADGKPGGALFVAGPAGAAEQAAGRPWASTVLRRLRAALAEAQIGIPLAFDHVVRCGFGSDETEAKVRATNCEPFTARVLELVRPAMVFAFGRDAQLALLGRHISGNVGRLAHGWQQTPAGLVPVYAFPDPAAAIGNRFAWRNLLDDVRHAVAGNHEPPDAFEVSGNIIETEDDGGKALLALRGGFAVDVETSGRAGDGDLELLNVACAPIAGGDVWIWSRAMLRDGERLGPLRLLLTAPDVLRVAFNVPFDVRVLQHRLGVRIPGRVHDARVVRKLLDTDASGALADCAELVGLGGHKGLIEEALARAKAAIREQVRALDAPPPRQQTLAIGEPGGGTRGLRLPVAQARRVAAGGEVETYAYALVPDELRARYCARDAYAAAALWRVLEPRLRADAELWDVYRFEAAPAAHAVAEIEAAGINVDRAAVESLSAYLAAKQNEEMRMMRQFGTFNPGSPAQVAALLYDTLGLRNPDGDRSTEAETLERMKLQHPIIPRLLEWRRLDRLRGQYADGMLPWIQADGRIYPGVLPEGTRSGRMSHHKPNLGNLPRAAQSEEARMVRAAFRASPGHWLVEIDYSQIELRVAALLSGEQVMVNAYRAGADLHLLAAKAVAAQEGIDENAWHTLPPDDRSRRRSDAKTAVFARLYGRGIPALAEQIKRTPAQTEQFVQIIFGHYRELANFTKRKVVEARAAGECRTWRAGRPARRRPLMALGYPERPGERTPAVVGTAERAAYNTPVQGTAAGMLNESLWPVVEWIRDCAPDVRLVLPIHDAMLFDVPEARVPETIAVVSAIMRAHDAGGVPLDVEAKVGRDWGAMQTWDPGNWPPAGK